MISFSCPRCGARYDVDGGLAGKRGRCKKCGHVMSIPAPSVSTAVSGMFRLQPDLALALASRDPSARAVVPPGQAAPIFPSSVGLAPLSAELRALDPRAPQAHVKPHIAAYLHESTTVGPYALVPSHKVLAPLRPSVGKPAGKVTRAYRGQVRGVLKLLRKLNDFAYLISIPFLMLVLLGIVLKSRPMALAGATAVILVNLGRLVTNGLAFFGRPFKDSPIQGILFLLPPCTIYYLLSHGRSMRKATRRFLEPVLTIGLVILAFLFIPWLSSGTVEDEASLRERVGGEAAALKADLRGELENRGASLDGALEGLTEKAQQGVEAVRGSAGSRSPSAPDENPGRNPPPR